MIDHKAAADTELLNIIHPAEPVAARVLRIGQDPDRATLHCVECGAPISYTQANLSRMRADDAFPACKDCVTAALTASRLQSEEA